MRQRALAYGGVQILLDLFVYRTPPPSLPPPPSSPSHSCRVPRTQTPTFCSRLSRGDARFPELSARFWKEKRDTHALHMCPAWLFHSRGLSPPRCSPHMPGRSLKRWRSPFTGCFRRTLIALSDCAERERAVDGGAPLAPVTHRPGR